MLPATSPLRFKLLNGGPEYIKYVALSYEMGSQDSADLFQNGPNLDKAFPVY